nr:hypothetical protein [Tanacetum cinerariifolium]
MILGGHDDEGTRKATGTWSGRSPEDAPVNVPRASPKQPKDNQSSRIYGIMSLRSHLTPDKSTKYISELHALGYRHSARTMFRNCSSNEGSSSLGSESTFRDAKIYLNMTHEAVRSNVEK